MRTLLMVHMDGRDPESEPIVVDTDFPDVVRLELYDGVTIEVDRLELWAAIRGTAA